MFKKNNLIKNKKNKFKKILIKLFFYKIKLN